MLHVDMPAPLFQEPVGLGIPEISSFIGLYSDYIYIYNIILMYIHSQAGYSRLLSHQYPPTVCGRIMLY